MDENQDILSLLENALHFNEVIGNVSAMITDTNAPRFSKEGAKEVKETAHQLNRTLRKLNIRIRKRLKEGKL